MLNEYMNILAHNERMKARFFPDWDKLRTGMAVLPRPVVNVHKWQPFYMYSSSSTGWDDTSISENITV